ncbi:MAG: ATPase, partial [Haloarculaceae archaeon]
CDWLVWHRLTWNNDTKVVKRIIDREHSEAVEDLDDGEGFLMTDWSESIRRVQFHRKKTFDAGATPGLDDFERPDLKSVSDDLVSELETISDEKQETEDRIEELRAELDKKNSRIAELEAELQDARDLQRMAEQFTQALVEHVEGPNPGRTEKERMRQRRAAAAGPGAQAGLDTSGSWTPDGTGEPTNGTTPAESSDRTGAETTEADPTEETRDDDQYATAAMTWAGEGDADGGNARNGEESARNGDERTTESAATDDDGAGDDGLFGMAGAGGFGEDASRDDAESGGSDGPERASKADESSAEADEGAPQDGPVSPESITRGFGDVEDNPLGDRATDAFASGTTDELDVDAEDAGAFVRHLRGEIEGLDARTRQMLRYYRDHGPGTPMDALFSAGGSDDRTEAYARNRRLRVRGLVEHVGRGRYDYCLPDLLREHTGQQQIAPYVERLEQRLDLGSRDSGLEGSAD